MSEEKVHIQPESVNALLSASSPLTEDEKETLRSLPFIQFMEGHGVERTPFAPINREFLVELCEWHGVYSYRLNPQMP